jgi:hypothetical protein
MASAAIFVEGVDDQDILFLGSVVIVNCGGTINMSTAPVRGPAGVVEAKVENIKKEMLQSGIGVRSESIFERPPDSSNIGEGEWRKILDKLEDINDRKALVADRLRARGIQIEKGGIVVTHGTDTLQVTALITALEFSFRPLVVPVIFTASHSPIETAGSDGLSNIRKAVFVAKERFCVDAYNLPPAVYVLIGQDVHLAARLTKVRTLPDSDGRYFFSFPAPVGRITGDKFHLRIDDVYLRRMLPEAPVHLLGRYERRRLFGVVEHLYVDKFASAVGLEDVRRRASFYRSEIPLDQRGVAFVVQGDFSANSEFVEIARIFAEISRDAPVFVGSKKSFEKIKIQMGGFNCFLLPKSMTHTKAQTKLRWLLSFSGIEAHIEEALNGNFAGESFDARELPEWINYETFPDRKKGTEVVIIYPDIHWKVVYDAIQRLYKSGHSNPRLFLFGFGDGHVPAVNLPIREIVRRHMAYEILGPVLFDNEEISVEDIVDGLARHFATASPLQLRDYLISRYLIDKRRLKSIMMSEVAQEIRAREMERLKKSIEGLLARRMRLGSVKLLFKHKEVTIGKILGNVRIVVPDDEAKDLLQNIEIEEWNQSLVDIMQARFTKALARRVIKDSVMASSKLLAAIGQAVDGGIDVRIRSLAMKSKTNTRNYETGNILMVLGVHSEEAEGWNTRYLKPRAELAF